MRKFSLLCRSDEETLVETEAECVETRFEETVFTLVLTLTVMLLLTFVSTLKVTVTLAVPLTTDSMTLSTSRLDS